MLGALILAGLLFLVYRYQNHAVTAVPGTDPEQVLAVSEGLKLKPNLIQGYLVGTAADSINLTANGPQPSRVPLGKPPANQKETVKVKLDPQAKFWKGGPVERQALLPGDVVYAEIEQGADNNPVAKRVWVNLGHYRGRVSEISADGLSLDASAEAKLFQELGKAGLVKPVQINEKTGYMDSERKAITFKDIKLGDKLTVIGVWDAEGRLTAARVMKN